MADIFNEMQDKSGQVRSPYLRVEDWLKTLKRKDVDRAIKEAENAANPGRSSRASQAVEALGSTPPDDTDPSVDPGEVPPAT